jgi:hypothetical protein
VKISLFAPQATRDAPTLAKAQAARDARDPAYRPATVARR